MKGKKSVRYEATTVSGRILSSYAPDEGTFRRRVEKWGERIEGDVRSVPLDGVPWTLEDNQYARPPASAVRIKK